MDAWIDKRVVVVIENKPLVLCVLRENHSDGIMVELFDGNRQFIRDFIRVELAKGEK